MAPTIRYSPTSSRQDSDYSDVKTYGGKTLRELAGNIVDLLIKNNIPVCNLYTTLGWNKYNFNQYFLSNDSTHPYKGFKDLAIKVYKFITSN